MDSRGAQQGKAATALDSLNAEMTAFLGIKNIPAAKNPGPSPSLKSAKVGPTTSSSNSSPICGSPRVQTPMSVAGMRPMAPHQPIGSPPSDLFASFGNLKGGGGGASSTPPPQLSPIGLKTPPAQQPSVLSPVAAVTPDSVWDSLFGPTPSKASAVGPSPPSPSAALFSDLPVAGETPAFSDPFSGSAMAPDSVPRDEDEAPPPVPAGLSADGAKGKAAELFKQGQYPECAKWYTWSIQLARQGNATSAVLCDLFCHRSECFKEVGQMKKATEDCSQALELLPSDIGALTRRAFLYESMEKYKLAKKDLESLVTLQPNNHGASSGLARIQKCIDSM